MKMHMKYSFSSVGMVSFTLLFSTLFIGNTTNSIYGVDINASSHILEKLMDSSNILGIVKDGSFIVAETNETKKLTSVGLVEAVSPESGLMNLTIYEGRAILVSSPQSNDEWIYGAAIIVIADPIVTKLVKEVYNLE